MIDKKYLELINKDIDKTISLNEKGKLDQYLIENPDANVLYNELLKAEILLDKLPDKEPSASLKQSILNSIEYNRYSYKEKKTTILDYFSTIFSGSRTKVAVSFALGLVAGIIILSVIFYDSYINNHSDVNKTYGTMGLYEADVVESVTVNSNDISGEINISKGSNFYKFKIDLSSSERYYLLIEFDPAKVEVDNLSLAELNNIQIEKGIGSIKLIESGNSPYSLLFSVNALYPHKFLLKILRDNSKLFEREVILSNN